MAPLHFGKRKQFAGFFTVPLCSLSAHAFGQVAYVDHFAFGIENFKVEEAAAKLRKRGLKPAVSKDGLKFIDPDGITVQLNAPDYPGHVPGK